jgi:hypothetical protein
MPAGSVVWTGLRPARRPARRAPVESVRSARAMAGQRLAGDHYRTRYDGSRDLSCYRACVQ